MSSDTPSPNNAPPSIATTASMTPNGTGKYTSSLTDPSIVLQTIWPLITRVNSLCTPWQTLLPSVRSA